MKKKKNDSTDNRIMHKISLGAVCAEQVRQGIYTFSMIHRIKLSPKSFILTSPTPFILNN